MDKLYFAVNKHYPWNFNFATRWFDDFPGEEALLPEQFVTMGFFSSTP